MREIKFRIWDKRQGLHKMHYPKGFYYYGDEHYNFVHAEFGGGAFSTFNKEDVEIMQFTGLYDKNKKPIYEGDIVQRGVILFDRGKFNGYYTESNGSISDEWEDDLYNESNIEVLGNIHENMNLLTD